MFNFFKKPELRRLKIVDDHEIIPMAINLLNQINEKNFEVFPNNDSNETIILEEKRWAPWDEPNHSRKLKLENNKYWMHLIKTPVQYSYTISGPGFDSPPMNGVWYGLDKTMTRFDRGDIYIIESDNPIITKKLFYDNILLEALFRHLKFVENKVYDNLKKFDCLKKVISGEHKNSKKFEELLIIDEDNSSLRLSFSKDGSRFDLKEMIDNNKVNDYFKEIISIINGSMPLAEQFEKIVMDPRAINNWIIDNGKGGPYGYGKNIYLYR